MGCCKDCGKESCNQKLLGFCHYECSAWLPETTLKGNKKTTINTDKNTSVKTDMVKVIRCKNCKHWKKNDISGEWPNKIKCRCNITMHSTKGGSATSYTAPDDYCSFAEKRME
jgi:hypothetical protein